MTSFLTTVSRYQVSLQHLAGKANLQSDFASRTAPNCNEPYCQICTFVHDTASRSKISSTVSPNSHSPKDQPGYRSKTIALISTELTPILSKALVHQRNLLTFVVSRVTLTLLPLLKTEFSWLNAVSHLFQLLNSSLYPGPY